MAAFFVFVFSYYFAMIVMSFPQCGQVSCVDVTLPLSWIGPPFTESGVSETIVSTVVLSASAIFWRLLIVILPRR